MQSPGAHGDELGLHREDITQDPTCECLLTVRYTETMCWVQSLFQKGAGQQYGQGQSSRIAGGCMVQ